VLNSLIKAGTIWAISVWLKPRWKKIVIAAVVVVLTWVGHKEFLEYAAIAGVSGGVGLSYFIKWSIITLVLLYLYLFLYIELPASELYKQKNKVLAAREELQEEDEEDGFSQIRQKRKLTSKGEAILKKYKSEKRKGL
jgi:hypothetical protein